MIIIFGLFSIAAIVLTLKHGAPKRFPWPWALMFAASLFAGGFTPLGTLERFFMFGGLLSAFIVGAHLSISHRSIWRYSKIIGIALAAFVMADALRIIPTPDVAYAGENMLLGLRRPYALAHPNLVAAWSLLLPFGSWTLLTVIVTQSRGALFGLLPVIVMRSIPRRFMLLASMAGAVLLAGAISIRPATALDRFNFWNEGAQLFLSKPIVGWGSGSYRTSLLTTSPQADLMNAVTKRTGMHTAHNALITIAAENGLIGIVPFAGFVFGLFMISRKSSHPAKWGLLAFASQQMFDDQWLHPVTSIVLGLTLAVGLSRK